MNQRETRGVQYDSLPHPSKGMSTFLMYWILLLCKAVAVAAAVAEAELAAAAAAVQQH
jgi:hypothetical protein